MPSILMLPIVEINVRKMFCNIEAQYVKTKDPLYVWRIRDNLS